MSSDQYSSTTRISDLPENITMQMPVQNQMMMGNNGGGGGGGGGGDDGLSGPGQNTYMPLNIHPNPYGVNKSQPAMSLPQSQPPTNRGSDQMMNMQHQQQQQQRLPSRDIPMNSLEFQQDEEIQPNYIPKAKLSSDYIREYEESSEATMKQHEKTKYREKMAKDLFSEMQTPILIAILYFIFQMPVVNTLLYKYFAFLSIYHTDGNFNFYGLIMKSALFGGLYYGLQSFTEYMT